ncbi:MAG: hypothetical protein ABR599_06885 [Gemmatimonadota bacterium]
MREVQRESAVGGGPFAAELDLENLLLRIPHVLGARVQMGDGGVVERIHVLANRSSRVDGLRHEVERLLEEQRALRLDPGVLSVVALDAPAELERTEREARGAPAPASRIELCRVACEPLDELTLRVRVDLRLDAIVFSGEVTDTDVPRARPILAARAVLGALEFLRERGAAFYLVGLEFLNGFHAPVALAVVEALSQSGIRGRKLLLTGCALVGDSREEAAARATLAALNRFHGSFGSPGER